MIKHFCDQCGIEVNVEGRSLIQIEVNFSEEGFENRLLELCISCAKHFDWLLDVPSFASLRVLSIDPRRDTDD